MPYLVVSFLIFLIIIFLFLIFEKRKSVSELLSNHDKIILFEMADFYR